jgi:hypothetical protein
VGSKIYLSPLFSALDADQGSASPRPQEISESRTDASGPESARKESPTRDDFPRNKAHMADE